MQHLSRNSECKSTCQKQKLKCLISCSSKLVRFCVLHRIKPHAPPLVQVSVNLFEFRPCDRTTQAGLLTLSLDQNYYIMMKVHRLGRGLPGSLIPFAPHAFVPQRQFRIVFCLRQWWSLSVSKNITYPPTVPKTSTKFKMEQKKHKMQTNCEMSC